MRRILIMGDEVAPSKELRVELEMLGYETRVTGRARGNVAVSPNEPFPDLVLINLGLGSTDDRSAMLEALRQEWQSAVALVLREADEAGMREAVPDSSLDMVVVPFTRRELRACVELAICRHQAEAVATRTEDRFFATSLDLLCQLNFNGYFRRLNPAWEKTLGFTRRELMSRPFIEFVHPDDRERTLAQNARVRKGGHAVDFENRYLCRDGSHRWFRWNAAADATGKVVYSVARDVTERKLAEAERDHILHDLRAALDEVKALQTILPICSYCRKVRDDENYWHTVEGYLAEHTETRFSHGICPSCVAAEVEPEFEDIDAGTSGRR